MAEYFIEIKVAEEGPKAKNVFNAEDTLERIHDESLPIASRAIVAFELILNCRPNEKWALRWSDIDWQTEQVHHYKAFSKDQHGFTLRDSTKTGRRGDRRLPPLGKFLADLLRRVQKARMKQGTASDYLFCEKKDSFKYAWRRIRAELNLQEGPTFYSLKTTGNSYALANGISSAAQAKKMGHTTTRMADNTYRTLMDAEVVEAVEVYGKPLNKTG